MASFLPRRAWLWLLIAAALGVFLPGIRWGLPSRAADPFLFGQRTPWTGKEILGLVGERSRTGALGADVDRDALPRGVGTVVLNDTDARRAAIVLRYRLFTYQPDEMITLMSLAQMRPGAGDLDPRLYQYGGMWIYPVGALLRGCAALGMVHLTPDTAFYLDHPEEFGRFYVVARLYSAAWGVLGALVVRALLRRWGASELAAAIGAGVFILMPAVLTMAHEAKPHLAGTTLILLTVLFADRYARDGRRRDFLLAALFSGLAAGMVLSAAVALLIGPMMMLFRPISWSRRVALAAGAVFIGVAAYFATNPYVLAHLLGDRAALVSNLSNSTAMYAIGRWPEGIANALRLIGMGASPVVAVLGTLAILLLLARRRVAPGLIMLLVLSAIVTGQFIALAAGKPPEYGRFALLVDVTLGLGAVLAPDRLLAGRAAKTAALLALLLTIAIPAGKCLAGFLRDSAPSNSRIAAAQELARLAERGADQLIIAAEPAPYSLPPVDLFHWRLLLADKTASVPPAAVRVKVQQRNMSWADVGITLEPRQPATPLP